MPCGAAFYEKFRMPAFIECGYERCVESKYIRAVAGLRAPEEFMNCSMRSCVFFRVSTSCVVRRKALVQKQIIQLFCAITHAFPNLTFPPTVPDEVGMTVT